MNRLLLAFALSLVAISLTMTRADADAPAPNLERLAQRIITTSVAVQPGEVVVIEGGKHTIPFMEALAIEAQKAGGQVTMWLDSDKVIRSLDTEVPERFLSQEPRFLAPWFRAIDVYITLPPVSDLAALDAGVSAKRLGEIGAAGEFLTPLVDGMKYRALTITYPTPQRGQSFKLAGPTYVNMLWAAMDADYAKIAAVGTTLRHRLAVGKTVRITSPAGTDVTFNLAGRTPNLSDGIITGPDAKGHKFVDRSAGLPDGVVSVAPLEKSASGKIAAPRALCRFEVMQNVSFTFKRGMATNFAAASGTDCFHQLVAASGGPTMEFASITIGLNPAWQIHEENGAAYYPAPASGLVFINVGDNQLLGGSVKTVGNFGFGFPITHATVFIDGVKVVDKGKLVS